MKLFIQDKFLSMHGHQYVRDENNKPYLMVKGKLFSPTRKRRVCDLNGNLLFSVRKKFFHLLPKGFIYDEHGEKIARIKKGFGFHHKFKIEGYKDDFQVEGDIFAWRFAILKNGVQIGTILKKPVALVDTFQLDIEDEKEAAFFVAFIACIDNIYDSKK